MKIAIVVSSPMTIKAFLHDLIIRLSEISEVTVVANISNPKDLVVLENSAKIVSVKIVRKIALFTDVKALLTLLSLFRRNKYDLVYSVTPKAGLLAMTASFLARINCRIHIFTGQVWVMKRGVRRLFLKIVDKLIVRLATNVLADSISQSKFLINENVVNSNKIAVLANGSISGVNLKRFCKDENIRNEVREQLNIDKNELVFLFLGRLDPDKGILDLVDAFSLIYNRYKFVRLVIVGPDEAGICSQIDSKIPSKTNNIIFVDFTNRPESYMNAADVICLPSYREGFGSVVIEAAAIGIPAIGSNIYGIRDAIEDGVTGILYPPRDKKALYSAMQKLILEPETRIRFGVAAQKRAKRLFSQNLVTSSYIDYFKQAVDSCISR